MQALIECDDLMADKDKLTQLLIQRISDYEKKTDGRFDGVEQRLSAMAGELGELKGLLAPREMHWTAKAAIAILAIVVPAFLGFVYHSVDHRLSALEDFAKQNGPFIAGLQVEKTASDPKNPVNIAEAKSVLANARAKHIRIAPTVVEESGKKFVDAGTGDSSAWGAALDFVGYRTTLNPSPVPLDKHIPYNPSARYDTNNLLNYPKVTIFALGIAKPPDIAQFRPISGQDMNATHLTAPAFLLVLNSELLLDGLHLRNVVIKDSHVIYRGGAVVLENVTFINCTFDVVNQPPGQEFATNVLAANTSFSLG